MSWGTILLFVVMGTLLVFVFGSLIATHLRIKKNQHLTFNFLKSLSYYEDRRFIKVNEKLELRIHNDFFLYFEVFAKSAKGEFVLVDKKAYYRPPSDIIQFDEHWHDEIAECLKELYRKYSAEK